MKIKTLQLAIILDAYNRLVITIHNSSLASQPVGFSQPQRTSLDNKPTPPAANEQNNSIQAPPASTPEQIQAAVAQIGLTKEDNFSQENNRRTNQALQAYNQTRNQPVQTQLENIISRVDYYA